MPVQKKKRKPNAGSFQKGNQVAVGNKGKTKEDKYKDRFISKAIEEQLLKSFRTKDGNKSTFIAAIAKRLVRTAAFADDKEAIKAIKEILDRMEGKAMQPVEVTGKDKKPIEVIRRDMSPAEAARIFNDMLKDD